MPSVSGELDAELVFELKTSPGQACVPSAPGVLKRELHRSVGIGTPRVEAGTGVGSLGCVTESGCILDPECVPESADPGRVTELVFAQDSVPASELVSGPGHVTESRCILGPECVHESAGSDGVESVGALGVKCGVVALLPASVQLVVDRGYAGPFKLSV